MAYASPSVSFAWDFCGLIMARYNLQALQECHKVHADVWTQVKAGDHIFTGAYYWKVKEIYPDDLRIILEWVGVGARPDVIVNDLRSWGPTQKAALLQGLVMLEPRKCAPCYDSDCECIYDNV